MHKPPIGPFCPHCGELAPYGDERHYWLRAHIDNNLHRWWWTWKNRKHDKKIQYDDSELKAHHEFNSHEVIRKYHGIAIGQGEDAAEAWLKEIAFPNDKVLGGYYNNKEI